MNTLCTKSINAAFSRDKQWIAFQTRPYQFFGMDKEDLMQEGAKAWTEAASRVPPLDNSAIFRAYALPFIRRALLEYAFSNQRIVSIGKSRKVESVILALRNSSKKGKITPSIKKDIANKFNISLKEVTAWEQYLAGGDTDCHSLTGGEIPISPDTLELLCWSEQEAKFLACEIGVRRLPPRERGIIEKRYLSDNQSTLDAIGRDLGVSTTRAWQLERQAINKLRHIIDKLPTSAPA